MTSDTSVMLYMSISWGYASAEHKDVKGRVNGMAIATAPLDGTIAKIICKCVLHSHEGRNVGRCKPQFIRQSGHGQFALGPGTGLEPIWRLIRPHAIAHKAAA